MPIKDERTPVRIAVLLRLIPDHCLTKKAYEQNAVVSVPTIDISQVFRHAATLTATDLLRVFVQEVTEPGQSKTTTLAVRKQLHLLPGESWMPAALRTLMHTKASNVQSYKPHAMEETYYWRCITGGQLLDHCERVIGVLNPSDTNPFHPVLHGLRAAIRKNLHKRAINEGQLLTRQMIDRGIAAQAMYGDFLQELSRLSHLYSPPLAENFSPRSPSRTPNRNPRHRFSAVASDRRPRHPVSPMRDVFCTRPADGTPTDAAAHHHPSPRDKHKRSLDKVNAIISSLRSEFSDDDPQESPPENPDDSNEPSDVPHDDHLDHDIQDTANEFSAFANKPASRPGKFGTPFIDGSSRPRGRPRLSGDFSASGRRTTRAKEVTSTSTSKSTTPVPAQATPAPATTTSSTPGQDPLPNQDAHSDVIRRALMKRQVCFYYAYGISCPHDPCKYLHEDSDTPYAWYRRSVSSHTSTATMAAFFHTEEAYGRQDPRDSE